MYQLLLVCVLLVFSHSVSASSLERLVMPGPVSSAHAPFENECSSCHDPLGESTQAQLCFACHEEVGADHESGSGFHGGIPYQADSQCQSCHREHLGRDAQTLNFDWVSFDHGDTDFPLMWAHGNLECQSCHVEGEAKTVAPTTCNGCHANDDPHQGGLGENCAQCHSQRNWLEQPSFNHSAFGFALTGGHAEVSCASCHAQNDFSSADSSCHSCHRKDDVHQGSFGTACQDCHSTSSFKQTGFDHLRISGFALTNGHAGLTCATCHTPGDTAELTSDCVSCHREDDVHNGANGDQCESCHNTTTWQGHSFDHAVTGFRLLGAHATTACADCHVDGVEAEIPRNCAGCHTQDPHAGQLGQACEDCHNPVQWSNQVAFHHEWSRFPLIGAHVSLMCVDCHASMRFHDAPTACVDCHVKDDVHKGRMGQDCARCHNPQTWKVARFDHARAADFALLGVHGELTCSACHDKPALLAVSDADNCIGCHRQDDPHEERFGADCASCHNNYSFKEVEGYAQ